MNNGKRRRLAKAAAHVPGNAGTPNPFGNRAQRRWIARHPEILEAAQKEHAEVEEIEAEAEAGRKKVEAAA